MVDSIPVILIAGTLLGFLSGLGVGGGSLLMLWLTLVVGMEYPQARTLNLLFFLPAAVVATLFRWKQCHLPWARILPAAIAGCLFAAAFARLGTNLNTTLLQKLFGILLLLTGVKELFYRQRKAK